MTLSIPGGITINYPLAYTLTFGGAGNLSIGPITPDGGNNITTDFNQTGTATLSGTNNLNAGTAAFNAGNSLITGSVSASVILVGNTAASAGAVYQSGTSTVTNTSTVGGGFQIGSIAGGFGYYNLSGGTINVGGELDPGGSGGGAGTFGQFDMSGGTVNLPNITGSFFLPDRGSAGEASVVNISGGTVRIAGGGTPANSAFNGLSVGLNNVGKSHQHHHHQRHWPVPHPLAHGQAERHEFRRLVQ